MEYDSKQVRRLRGAPRRKIFHPVELRAGGNARRAHLLDLSAGGALAHCVDPPAAGVSIILVIGEVAHAASVMWRDGLRFGMAFRFHLSAAEIERVTAQATIPVNVAR